MCRIVAQGATALAKDTNVQQQTPEDVAVARGRPVIAKHFKTTVESVADEDLKRVIIAPDTCFLHHSCPPITRLPADEPPPENVNRLNVLLNETNGTLRGKDFKSLNVEYVSEVEPAAWVDGASLSRVCIPQKGARICDKLPDIRMAPRAIGTIDGDTAVCSQSFNAALSAAGATIEAVERIVSGGNQQGVLSPFVRRATTADLSGPWALRAIPSALVLTDSV